MLSGPCGTQKYMPSKSSEASRGNNHFIAARTWPHCLASSYWLWSKILKKDIPTHKSTPNCRRNTVTYSPPVLLSPFSVSGAHRLLKDKCSAAETSSSSHSKMWNGGNHSLAQAIWAFKLLDYLSIEILVLNYLNICLGSVIHFRKTPIGWDWVIPNVCLSTYLVH